MKNKDLFNKTIGILVNAFMNNNLTHSDACGCAIGNLVAANNQYRIEGGHEENVRHGGDLAFISGRGIVHPDWCLVHSFGEMHNGYGNPHTYIDNGMEQLLSTGYSIEETCLIEKAFESVNRNIDKSGYMGLMSVCDTLMEIHEATTDEITEAKQLFVKA